MKSDVFAVFFGFPCTVWSKSHAFKWKQRVYKDREKLHCRSDARTFRLGRSASPMQHGQSTLELVIPLLILHVWSDPAGGVAKNRNGYKLKPTIVIANSPPTIIALISALKSYLLSGQHHYQRDADLLASRSAHTASTEPFTYVQAHI